MANSASRAGGRRERRAPCGVGRLPEEQGKHPTEVGLARAGIQGDSDPMLPHPFLALVERQQTQSLTLRRLGSDMQQRGQTPAHPCPNAWRRFAGLFLNRWIIS